MQFHISNNGTKDKVQRQSCLHLGFLASDSNCAEETTGGQRPEGMGSPTQKHNTRDTGYTARSTHVFNHLLRTG